MSADYDYRLLKLNVGPIAQPYVSTTVGIARVDRCRLLSEEDRRASNQIRRVEDPIKIKESAKKVGRFIFYCSLLPVMKISQIFLTRK